MENQSSSVEALIDRLKIYFETRVDLLRLKAIDKSTSFFAFLLSVLMVLSVGFLFIIIISVGIALLIGDLLGKAYYGFFIVAGFYLIIGLIIIIFRKKWIKRPIANSMIKNLMD